MSIWTPPSQSDAPASITGTDPAAETYADFALRSAGGWVIVPCQRRLWVFSRGASSSDPPALRTSLGVTISTAIEDCLLNDLKF